MSETKPDNRFSKSVRLKELSDLIGKLEEAERRRMRAISDLKDLIQAAERDFGICPDEKPRADEVISSLYREIGFEFLHGDGDV